MITKEATAAVAEAVSALERFRESLSPAAAAEHEEDINALLGVLAADPVLGRVLALQDSLSQLRRHLQRHPSLLPNDFDFCPQTGALTLGAGAVQLGEDEIDHEARDEEEEEEEEDDNNNNNNNSDSCEPSSEADQSLSHAASAAGGVLQYSPELSGSSVVHCGGRAVTTPGYLEEFERAIARGAAGRQILRVELARPPGASLGFSVVGLRSPSRGELGIFVQELQPNGIAQRDGRLEEGDQILAIDGQPLDSNISHQQAIGILQQARGTVQLVLARGTPVSATPPATQGAPVSTLPSSSLSGSVTAVTKSAAEREEAMVLGTEWAEVEAVELLNDGSGLGFGIIGGRSTGVVVKTVLPGGVADRDGRLQSGDHILQIGDVNLRGLGSEQVASVLRQAGARVRLVVARPSESGDLPAPRPSSLPPPLVLPTRLLADADELERRLQIHSATVAMATAAAGTPGSPLLTEISLDDLPETETFEVELVKDQQGLGITIAGYVCEKGTQDEISGIFVKSVAKGSAADASGCIRVNDQIIEVDGRSLQGYTNHQAVEVLRSTGKCVKLRLARHLRGARYLQLQHAVALSDAGGGLPPLPTTPTLTSGAMTPVSLPGSSPVTPEQPLPPLRAAVEDSIVTSAVVDGSPYATLDDEDGIYAGELDPKTEASIVAHWSNVVGPEFEIVVAQLSKFEPGGGLGISLEGTVDVEDGREVRPHHYIRSVLPDGPVGLNGRLRPGDELLQVNGRQLLGLHHREVVGALKQLPLHVRLVCSRPLPPPLPLHGPPALGSISRRSPSRAADESDPFADDSSSYTGLAQSPTGLARPSSSSSASPPPPLLGGGGGLGGSLPALVKAKSDGSLAQSDWEEGLPGPLVKLRSRSLEPLTGLAMWSSEPHVVELLKGERGLGFSILDYQDPMNPSETVIVIRSLVPGGVAQQDGRLIPGDRLLFVNDVPLQHAGLDAAVQALKGAPRGIVRIGVAKPLPLPPPPDSSSTMGVSSASCTQVGGTGGSHHLRRPPLLKAESF